jgi:hypothetical protein
MAQGGVEQVSCNILIVAYSEISARGKSIILHFFYIFLARGAA